MPDRLTDQIAQLVETWRNRMNSALAADNRTSDAIAEVYEVCADELAALLATHQEKHPRQVAEEREAAANDPSPEDVARIIQARMRPTGAL